MSNTAAVLFVCYILIYPLRLFLQKWEKVQTQMSYKDENLDDLIVNTKEFLEGF